MNPPENYKFVQISRIIVHSADLSAPVHPLLLPRKLGNVICQGSTNQVEKERN